MPLVLLCPEFDIALLLQFAEQLVDPADTITVHVQQAIIGNISGRINIFYRRLKKLSTFISLSYCLMT